MIKRKNILAGALALIMTAGVVLGSGVSIKAADTYKTGNDLNGHYYMFIHDRKDWQSAKDAAEYMGGHLVTVNSLEEQTFIREFISYYNSDYYGRFWSGGYGVTGSGDFKWITGEPMSYTNWAPKNPNGEYGDADNWQIQSDNSVIVIGAYSKDGGCLWTDEPTDKFACQYIVEWDSKDAYINYIKSGAKSFNGHQYKYFDGEFTWMEAKDLCESFGGHLVTITSEAENEFAWKLCDNKSGWIGLTDRIKEGEYQWVTGERTDYMAFEERNGTNYEDYDFFGYIKDRGYYDWDCYKAGSKTSGFICEWDEFNIEEDGTIYRMYDPSNGDHIYTTSASEVKSLIGQGWQIEASPGKTAASSGVGIYRLKNNATGEHLFTADKNEVKGLKKNGWTCENSEKPVFYGAKSGKAFYRLFNPGSDNPIASHHFSADANEVKILTGNGWQVDNGGNPVFYLAQ